MYSVDLFPSIPGGGTSKGRDITRYIEKNGLKKITQSVDSSDFSTEKNYNFIRLKLINHKNNLSINSTSSFFKGDRDGSIIRVTFTDEDGKKTIPFEGVIDDAGTYENESKRVIEFVVISFESLFSKVLVKNPKALNVPLTAKSALARFLSSDYLPEPLVMGGISVGINFDINIPEWFSNKTLKEAVDSLLLSTNSLLFINNRTVTVVPREKERKMGIPVFFGHNDKFRRSPVIFELKDINSGRQRVFNSIKVNETTSQDIHSIQMNGLKHLSSITAPYVNDSSTEIFIGRSIIRNFLYEKEELEIKVLSKDVQGLVLGDLISLDFNSRVEPTSGQRLLSVYDISTTLMIPEETGRIIPRAANWEIYEKVENTKELNCTMKLRQV